MSRADDDDFPSGGGAWGPTRLIGALARRVRLIGAGVRRACASCSLLVGGSIALTAGTGAGMPGRP